MLEPTDDPNVFINKLTKRRVKKGSQQYCKIMMEQNEKNTENPPSDVKNTHILAPSRKSIQKKTKKVLNEIAKENKAKLEKSKDIEGELRKLLYEKLCMIESTTFKKQKEKKHHSMKKWHSSSESSNCESESESE